MCLEIRKGNKDELPIKIAEKDIPCLKLLEIRKIGYPKEESCHVTPYRGVLVQQEVLRGEKDFLPKKCKPGDYEFDSYDTYADIGAGAIHTFACTQDSVYIITGEIEFLRGFICPHTTVVYLCVIPKGTEYMEGTFDGHKCYGSKAVRFKRELLKYDSSMRQDKVSIYAKVKQEISPIIEEMEFGEE